MRQALAERLLIQVMEWSPENVAIERPILEAMAEYKYDEYQQFSPGMRFLESLATWLTNFDTLKERERAYDFIKNNLVFISSAEMRHLVSITYPHSIRQILLKETADRIGEKEYRIAKIKNSQEFKLLCRESLFLGLSDGAHMDFFRRTSGLSNEQVYVDYRMDDEVAIALREDLAKDMKGFEKGKNLGDGPTFKMVFLINDFSASSDTLIRLENGEVTGKIPRAMEIIKGLQAMDPPVISPLDTKVFIILYVATDMAICNLNERLSSLSSPSWPSYKIQAVCRLGDHIKVNAQNDNEFNQLLEKYYDPSIMTKHLEKGGPDVIHGYAGCSLPLTLSHNTPNNSVYLLWSDLKKPRTHGLFPRVSRHKSDII